MKSIPLKKNVISYCGPEVKIPPLLRMRDNKRLKDMQMHNN